MRAINKDIEKVIFVFVYRYSTCRLNHVFSEVYYIDFENDCSRWSPHKRFVSYFRNIKIHWFDGQFHRPIKKGPAYTTQQGNKMWYHYGLLHRVDGAAIEYTNGDRKWYYKGKLHRLFNEGPAVDYVNGLKKWYYHGKLHRPVNEGPAFIYAHNDGEEYWEHGERIYKTEVSFPINPD